MNKKKKDKRGERVDNLGETNRDYNNVHTNTEKTTTRRYKSVLVDNREYYTYRKQYEHVDKNKQTKLHSQELNRNTHHHRLTYTS